MNFQVLVDSSLLDLGLTDGIETATNKSLLSVVNDFEDGKWRHETFYNFVWDNIAETALTLKEREALKNQPHSLLVAAAKNLRMTDAEDDFGKGSELAEIVLYGLMRHKYGALPVVPKIFYKQNSQDNAKGADSVHIVLGTGSDFSLWFGEAKFFNSIEDTRLSSIIKSVRNALATDKLKKENSIILNVPELDALSIQPNVRAAIRSALKSDTSIDNLKNRLNIPILLLHECSLTQAATEFSEDYKIGLDTYHRQRAHSYFQKHFAALKDIYKYADIRFHLILFPVPEKQPIVDRFVKSVGYYKG